MVSPLLRRRARLILLLAGARVERVVELYAVLLGAWWIHGIAVAGWRVLSRGMEGVGWWIGCWLVPDFGRLCF